MSVTESLNAELSHAANNKKGNAMKQDSKPPTPPALASVTGSAAPDVVALQNWMHEITQLLCFQPDVPMQHKTDLCNALNEYNQVVHAQRLVQQNS